MTIKCAHCHKPINLPLSDIKAAKIGLGCPHCKQKNLVQVRLEVEQLNTEPTYEDLYIKGQQDKRYNPTRMRARKGVERYADI